MTSGGKVSSCILFPPKLRTNHFRKTACCLLGNVSHKEVPEELKPKKPDQAST
jgi:hypothetical protein